MIYKELLLKNIEPKLKNSDAKLRIYISERNEAVSLRPGLLVCPGGGYSFCSPREAEIIAFRFLSEGFNCFIVNYSIKQQYPAPHLDLAAAFSYIREHETEFDLIPNSLSLIGFSAGGHLVGSYSYLYKELADIFNYNEQMLRPLSVVLAYPVTLTNEYGDKTTIQYITGNNKDLIKKLNIPSNIDETYPPAFVISTKTDELVPCINSELMEQSLTKNCVFHKCKIYDFGPHGISLVNRSCYKKEDLSINLRPARDWASDVSDFIFSMLDNKHE